MGKMGLDVMGKLSKIVPFFSDFPPIFYQFHTFHMHFPKCMFGNVSQFPISLKFPPCSPRFPRCLPFPPISPRFPPFPPRFPPSPLISPYFPSVPAILPCCPPLPRISPYFPSFSAVSPHFPSFCPIPPHISISPIFEAPAAGRLIRLRLTSKPALLGMSDELWVCGMSSRSIDCMTVDGPSALGSVCHARLRAGARARDPSSRLSAGKGLLGGPGPNGSGWVFVSESTLR